MFNLSNIFYKAETIIATAPLIFFFSILLALLAIAWYNIAYKCYICQNKGVLYGIMDTLVGYCKTVAAGMFQNAYFHVVGLLPGRNNYQG
jgi:hypothetical protein